MLASPVRQLASLALLFAACGSSLADSTRNASVLSDGRPLNHYSIEPSISGDGRYVVYWSIAPNLGIGNGAGQVVLRDMVANTTEVVSRSASGEVGNSQSYEPAISSDGKWIVFTSNATNLVPGDDTNGVGDVFLYSREKRSLRRISCRTNGEQANGDCSYPSISADGRFVAFVTKATNLVATDPAYGPSGVYPAVLRMDTKSGACVLASATPGGQWASGDCGFLAPTISADGSKVAFASSAADLSPHDTNGRWDAFVRDVPGGRTTRITNGDNDSYRPQISADGKVVAFYSWARNLISGTSTTTVNVYSYDLASSTTELVSSGASGVAGNGDSNDPSISADGRYVAFKSKATDIVVGAGGPKWSVFVRDRLRKATFRVDQSSDGQAANDTPNYFGPSITEDGGFVAYNSAASNLTPGTAFNGTYSVYVGVVPGAKLAAPRLITDGGSSHYSQRLYLRGYGSAASTGTWRRNGRDYASFNVGVDLSSGDWTPATELQLPWETARTSPRIDCQVSGPVSATTGATSMWVTGFDPAQDGWQFANDRTWDPTTYIGLCVGMSWLARTDFLYGPPISTEGTIQRLTWLRIRVAHISGKNWIEKYDMPRLRSYGYLDNLLDGESGRLLSAVAAGKPTVAFMRTLQQGSFSTEGHAVLAVAAFFAEDALVLDDMATRNARSFALYDPNVPRVFSNLEVSLGSGGNQLFSAYEWNVLGASTLDR